MQRRGESGQQVKGRRAIRPKARKAPTADASIADLQKQLNQRIRELDEALQQQTATSEVLRVISSSPSDLKPLFETILANATRLCGAKFGMMNLSDGDLLRIAAVYNVPPAFVAVQNVPFRLHPQSGHAQIVRTKRAVQISDIRKMPPYLEGDPRLVALADIGRARTTLGVPMLKEDKLLGTIVIYRQEVRPFSDKQIALLETFAAQAAIAIENARLLNELRQRTDDLSESLQQQTATADILKVISSSPGDLKPVFESVLENATRLCDAKFGTLFLHDGESFRFAADVGAPREYTEFQSRRGPFKTNPGTQLGQVLHTRRVTHTADYSAEPLIGPSAKVAGARSSVSVPMLKDEEFVGAIQIFRLEVRPFTDKQIALLENFAAQAVIAIENARLLNELRQRTDDLSDSLERQTATSEVLGVISQSTSDLQPVVDTIAATAARLCQSDWAVIFKLAKDGKCHLVANNDANPDFIRYLKINPISPGRNSTTGRAVVEGRTIHVHDVLSDPEWTRLDSQAVGKQRTLLSVPLLREGVPIGVISLARTEVKPYTDKQIELVTTFADQAVIAIENVRLFEAERQRTQELSETLEQQTATSEVLKVISGSQGELEPVFNAMLENAVRICGAKFGNLMLSEADVLRTVALYGAPPEYAEARRREPLTRHRPGTALGQVLATKRPAQIADVQAESSYYDDPSRVGLLKLAGARTVVAVPMLKEDDLVGAIFVYRQEVRPFTEKQIELLKNFAAQAVIAIENTRLLSELRESLQQQTATSEVLKVISSSPGELEPVFQTMLENAVRICEAKIGTLYLHEADAYRAVAATSDAPAAYVEARRRQPHLKPPPDGPLGRAAITKQVVHVADIMELQSYLERHPVMVDAVELGKFRTALAVPMLKDDELIGAITIMRQQVRPFTDKQIDLVQNFAAQAVIAIENARLLNELRESLQQQTATADVLKVISRSTFELQTVLNTLIQSVIQLCDAESAHIFRRIDDTYRIAACGGYSPEYEEYARGLVFAPGRDSLVGRIALEGRQVHIADALADPEYDQERAQKLGGWRTMLGVPLSREGMLIGAMTVTRSQVRPFTDKQLELLTTFADQAVIAIENTRLLTELRESLQQQTATADVLKVISRSTFDLGTVLQTLVESAARLCDADKTNITRQKDGVFFRAEAYGFSPEFMDYVRNIPIQPDRGSAFGRALLERRAVHIPDVKADPEYTLVEGQKLGDYRTVLAVPMLREGVVIGVLSLTRSEVRPFSEKQIELATTFADQAAIAIENVRLFESVEQRTRELAKSLEDLRTTQDRLVQTQKLASLGQLTAGIAHEIKNPLNFVNNFSGISAELIIELQEALADVSLNEKRRSDITELMDTLRGNLDRVVQHGKRADAIVKNMLLHSREGSGEHRVVDINALVEESLNLAYHGARAEKQGFNITMERSLDPAAGQADIFPQDITRALLNLISNGFYAATKRRADADRDGYEPTLVASTRSLGERVEIRVRDNGTGIPPEVKEKMFNPFFTTKPAGEGTGLGLSICHDIIVKQHGGSIEVDTQPGEFTEIRVILPRTVALLPA